MSKPAAVTDRKPEVTLHWAGDDSMGKLEGSDVLRAGTMNNTFRLVQRAMTIQRYLRALFFLFLLQIFLQTLHLLVLVLK